MKASIAWGPVAYFQKAHESGTDDWSAEGEPFVRAARLEQAIESKPQLVFYAVDYDTVFSAAPAPTAERGERYFWNFERRKLQVAGLGLTAGWTEVISMEHLPGGRV